MKLTAAASETIYGSGLCPHRSEGEVCMKCVGMDGRGVELKARCVAHRSSWIPFRMTRYYLNMETNT